MPPQWKKRFIEHYKPLTDIDKFLEYSVKPLKKSIRVNTIKSTVKEIKENFKGMKLKQVPWCKQGFWLEGYGIGNTMEHFLGKIYIQGAASMIPPIVLNPKKDEKVLDMCASPGSKASQIAAMMDNQGLLIANDNRIDRMKPLVTNLERCGTTNTVITLMQGRHFEKTGIDFDKILVDAPCSGIGTIRKSLKTIDIWNPEFSRKMHGLQKQLVKTAFNRLKPEGTLVYSTCTLEPDENEGIVDFMLEEFDNIKVEKISLDIKSSRPIQEFNGKEYSSEVKKTLRIWPQDNDTEGFFVAKIKKI